MSAPRRIVHVAGSADWGGGERYLELMARHLDRDAFALEVITPTPGALCGRLAAHGVPTHVVDLQALVSPRATARLASALWMVDTTTRTPASLAARRA